MFSLVGVVSSFREAVVRPEEEMVLVMDMKHRAEVLGAQMQDSLGWSMQLDAERRAMHRTS